MATEILKVKDPCLISPLTRGHKIAKIQVFIGNAYEMILHKFDYKEVASVFPVKYFVISFQNLE
jgi:hypothetical protein